MLKLSHPITSINGFKIGDKVRLKDGDGRPHFIKSFSIDGMKEFFFEVQFEDGTVAMLDNIALLPSNLDEAAVQAHMRMEESGEEMSFLNTFKAGAKWGEKDTIERAVKWWERNLRYLIAAANVRDTYLTDFKRDIEEGL